MSEPTQAILVLGMHRSGTSAIAGVLHLLGAATGSNLIPADENINPKGFWEDASVNALNEKLLESLGSYWFDSRSLPDRWWEDERVRLFQSGMEAIVRERFLGEKLWLIKDPRLCRLLPLWISPLSNLHIQPNIVLILRHPFEVARSLKERDGIEFPHAYLLWMRYVLESERNSRNLPRVFVTYDALLEDWQNVIRKIKDALSLGIEVNERNKIEIDRYLEEQLRHYKVDFVPDDPFGKLANKIYEEALGGNLYQLQSFQDELEVLTNQFNPWLEEINHLMEKKIRYESEVSRLSMQNMRIDKEISRIKSSFSWRLTAPLRTIGHLYSKSARQLKT